MDLVAVVLLLGNLSDTAARIGALSAAVLALAGFWRWAWLGKLEARDDGPRQRTPGFIKRVGLDLRAFRDAILGRDAIRHPDTGRVLADAVPGIGARMAASDDRLERLTAVVETIADSHKRVDAIEIRLATVEQAIGGERVLKGIESVQLLRTMEAVANAEPPHGDEDTAV